jgi:hypothetical protein
VEKIETPAQFAAAVISGGSIEKAAELAGLPVADASYLATKPEIQAEIVKRVRAHLLTVTLPRAMQHLDRVLIDESASNRDKNSAAKIVGNFLDATGGHKSSDASTVKKPADMSRAELLAFVGSAQRELSERAAPIIEASAPDSKPAKP